MQEQRFEAGDTIYREGDPGDVLYVIAEGEVEVLRTAGTSQVRLAVLSKGAVFGETGVVLNQAHTTTVRAIDAVAVISVPAMTPVRSRVPVPLLPRSRGSSGSASPPGQ